MRKLTVKEYAEEQGITEKTVYKHIRSNQVKHTLVKRNGQSVKMIVVEDEVKPVRPVEEQNILLQSSSISSSHSEIPNSSNDQLIIHLTTKMAEYAELAGQTKLLMDSEHRTKQEYFQLMQENAMLKAKLQIYEEKDKKINLLNIFKKI